jgi:hypothetical protein
LKNELKRLAGIGHPGEPLRIEDVKYEWRITETSQPSTEESASSIEDKSNIPENETAAQAKAREARERNGHGGRDAYGRLFGAAPGNAPEHTQVPVEQKTTGIKPEGL